MVSECSGSRITISSVVSSSPGFLSILDIRDVEGKHGPKYQKTENIKGRKNSRLKQNEKKKTGKEDIVQLQLKLDTRGEAGSESEKGVRLTKSFFILKARLSVVKRTPTLQNHLSSSPCDTQAPPSLQRRRVPSRQQCCPWPGPFSPHLPTFIPADIISPLSFVFPLDSLSLFSPGFSTLPALSPLQRASLRGGFFPRPASRFLQLAGSDI